MPAQPMIETATLTKRYGDKRGIIDVSLVVQPGDVFGFLGPNGAGKTTTIRLLMGLLRADSGGARIGGLDCWRDSVAVKREIGYLPAEPSVDGNLTGGQILEYFANLRGGVDQQHLTQLIDRFELDPTRKFRQYSSGNKRKVVLIQAFMHRPKLLILDEPTNGLDPLNQQEFARLVTESRNAGATAFISSHMLSEVEEICSRVGIIREGRVVRTGGIAEVKDIKRTELTITFAEDVPAAAFASLPGVVSAEAVATGHGVHVTVQGSPDDVIKTAARHRIVSLSSHEPSLEDIFLRYYGGDGHAPAVDAAESVVP